MVSGPVQDAHPADMDAPASCPSPWSPSSPSSLWSPSSPSSLWSPPAVTFVVNTCHAYAATTLTTALESLSMARVPDTSVVVVVGQCPGGHLPDDMPVVARGTRVVARDFGAGALTGLVWASSPASAGVVDTPWVVYLHDTMVAGPDFRDRVHDVCRAVTEDNAGVAATAAEGTAAQTRCVKLLDTRSLGVGLYDTAWLRTLDLEHLKAASSDSDGGGGVKAWREDKVFLMCPLDATRFLGRFDSPESRHVMGEFRYSETSPPRVIEHYPALDVYKLKRGETHAA